MIRILITALAFTWSCTMEASIVTGTRIEVRISNPVGSRISHTGDAVEATVIAPVYSSKHLLVPQGAQVRGTVTSVQKLGLRLKRTVATVELRFDRLEIPEAAPVAIDGRVIKIETAREKVNAEGAIQGIHPLASVSSGMAPYLAPIWFVSPNAGLALTAFKAVLARAPDPEIYFPAGTEMVVELTGDVSIPAFSDGIGAIPALSPDDLLAVKRILSRSSTLRASKGQRPSDLVNLLIFGNRGSLDRAFDAAGWLYAHPLSLKSGFQVYQSVVQRMGYTSAPMTTLKLNGTKADAEYQKSLDTFSKRHHVRLWRDTPEDAWLTAATEDIGYRFRRMHLTHSADPAIDNERNKLTNDLAFTGCLEAASLVPRPLAIESGPDINTDGRVAVLRLNDCSNPTPMPRTHTDQASTFRRQAAQRIVAFGHDVARTNPAVLALQAGILGWRQAFSAPLKGGKEVIVRADDSRAETMQSPSCIRPSALDGERHVSMSSLQVAGRD